MMMVFSLFDLTIKLWQTIIYSVAEAPSCTFNVTGYVPVGVIFLHLWTNEKEINDSYFLFFITK